MTRLRESLDQGKKRGSVRATTPKAAASERKPSRTRTKSAKRTRRRSA
jgi:hypothetical protein